EFLETMSSVAEAMEQGRTPARVAQGSSGSYFCPAPQPHPPNKYLIIFKPKDEEPYGLRNPKWTKWLHRNLCPCFFGRGCLIPNQGYISEAAASYMDTRLGLGIVPRTEVVHLASPVFHYPRKARTRFTKHGEPLPPKIGSAQLFVPGYIPAVEFFRRYPWISSEPTSMTEDHGPKPGSSGGSEDTDCPEDTEEVDDAEEFSWTDWTRQQFFEELEKMVVLDYIIRNTDRGLDNWLIRPCKDPGHQGGKGRWHVHLAAIDHGLALPYKHPDAWRSYPYGWLFLKSSIISKAFTRGLRSRLLPFLTSPAWWEGTVNGLRRICREDEDYSEEWFMRQVAVLKGQAWNLVESLRDPGETPVSLCRRVAVVVWEDVEEEGRSVGEVGHASEGELEQNSGWKRGAGRRIARVRRKVKERLEVLSRVRPCFTHW
ncbi:MAG: phosphatidylinositol 4-kinase type 2 beta, partial [Piptocephalis tieghemiana]